VEDIPVPFLLARILRKSLCAAQRPGDRVPRAPFRARAQEIFFSTSARKDPTSSDQASMPPLRFESFLNPADCRKETDPARGLPRRVAELDSSQEMVVHCRSGKRSADDIHFLQSAGFQETLEPQGRHTSLVG